MDPADRLARLGALMLEFACLWRPQAFRDARPAWCDSHPDLARRALALSDAETHALENDGAALHAWAAASLPELAPLHPLCELPRSPCRPAVRAHRRVEWEIPGRKLGQVQAFAHAVGQPRARLVEWCSGKGHLGRLLAANSGAAVTSVERDPALCREGEALARRVGVAQRFVESDVLQDGAAHLLVGAHAVALHACGDLHLALLHGGARERVAALDLAPCCYHLTRTATYLPLAAPADLGLDRDDLRLAVAQTGTAAPRELRQRRRERAWKLGFDRLRRDLSGVDAYVPTRPVPAAWGRGDFESFCRRLGAREGLALPASVDWARYEAHGERRAREVARLELVRHVFRRPLEIWLALDRACYLEGAGYRVRLSEFCAGSLTPRNLLISARLD